MDSCPQCNHPPLRKHAKFCVYCGYSLGSCCPHCNTKHKYGKKICDNCDNIIFSLFDYSGVERNIYGEITYIDVNNIRISVVWEKLISDIQALKNNKNITKNKLITPEDTLTQQKQEKDNEETEITDTTYTNELDVSEDENEEDVFASSDSTTKLSQRQHIINEILTTERDYNNDLDYINEVFINGLKGERFITRAEIDEIFSNIEQIREVNYDLFRYLQNADDCPSVPHAFMYTIDRMKIYGTYCSNLEKALEFVVQLSKAKPLFASFLAGCKLRRDSRSLDLNSWLIKPLQRLCKYPLFLNQLKQATPPNDPEYEILKEATLKIEELVTNVNTYKKDVESKKKAAELSQKLEGADVLHLMEPGRYFVQEGPVQLFPKDRGHYHLFSDLLIISRKKKVEDSIALDWCIVKEKIVSNKVMLEVAHIGVRTWSFLFENDAEKLMFVKKISELIDSAMNKAFLKYRDLGDNNPMEYETWRAERESIQQTKSPVEKRKSANRLSGLFKLGT